MASQTKTFVVDEAMIKRLEEGRKLFEEQHRNPNTNCEPIPTYTLGYRTLIGFGKVAHGRIPSA